MPSDAHTAVHDLHTDLATWLGTAAPDAVFDRFAAAQHPLFTMVTISGETLARDALLTGLRGAGNTRPGLRITISDITDLVRDTGTAVLRFLETHHYEGVSTQRWVTAVLVADAEHRWLWRSVHETPAATR
ncbi:hypothetical protein [Nocardia donostiensis]|uniref:DUF4440 domain-containing protein n=1 Tax=Nocardia donostiensis TaxID=1538463 RepID=A0A1V2TE78_9NOCA|nr:hypothetical protein [Nocardia donostiensis]ONM47807.1 hypothetical protein B0T46_16350 [Nocardia donostiensis]OQS13737.1 hypothetical protein B0T36_18685 [Nocardia donostiensis]OQS22559.1 hypothetical protein B0T44_05410 [Nocardia donostiensis]